MTAMNQVVGIIQTGEAASILNLSRGRVRQLAEEGELATAGKLPGKLGPYLFDAEVVRALARCRAEEQRKKLAETEAHLQGEGAAS